jgi:alpha-galactosidase
MTKVVAIGIGSVVFGVELLRDVFQTPELRGSELWLIDTDEAALRRMTGLAARLEEASGWGVRVRGSSDRRRALPDADFVVTSVAVDRDRTWKLDHALALEHGFPSVLSENGGPGGLSHTLRSVPLMVDIARDVERLAPRALMLNYTNPENRVCLALRRYTAVRAIGLCHGVAETAQFMADVLGRPRAEIRMQAAGVNHFTWTMSLIERESGRDLLPEFRERLRRQPEGVWPLCRLLFERFGAFPGPSDNHVGEYIGWAAEIAGTTGYDFVRFAQNRALASANLDAWCSGEKPVDALLARPSREARLGHASAQIMAAVVGRGTIERPSFIHENRGCIENLPAGAVVETPGFIDAGEPCGVPVGALPGPIASMVSREIEIQELAVEAAMTGSREMALQALLIDPVVHSASAAEAFLEDVLREHTRYLPAFA